MDTISNLLTSIRNAEGASHDQVTVPNTKMSVALLTILKENEYVTSVEVSDDKKTVTVGLIPGVRHSYKRVSTPGRRLYTPARDIPIILRGLGIVILSTSKGLMTGKAAHKQKLGGELICEVS